MKAGRMAKDHPLPGTMILMVAAHSILVAGIPQKAIASHYSCSISQAAYNMQLVQTLQNWITQKHMPQKRPKKTALPKQFFQMI
jgi:hypothetical protein